MNERVAAGAGSQFLRSRVHSVNRAGSDLAMALVAQCVDVRHVQQPGILRTVRSVAPYAALRLHRSVLIHKGSPGLRVALGADRVLIGCGLHVVVSKSAMNVVAIGATHGAFVDLVVERHIEGCLCFGVALIAKLRLRSLQQVLLLSAGVHAVTARATHIGLGVRRALEVRVRSRVAAQTGLVHVFGRGLGGIEDLGGVAAAFDVCTTRAVTPFAGDAGLAMHLGDLGMGIRGESLGNLVMAGCAGFRTDKIRSGCFLGLAAGRFSSRRSSAHRRGANHSRAQQKH